MKVVLGYIELNLCIPTMAQFAEFLIIASILGIGVVTLLYIGKCIDKLFKYKISKFILSLFE